MRPSGIVYSISNQKEGQLEASFSKSTQLVNLKEDMNAKANAFQKYRLDFAIFVCIFLTEPELFIPHQLTPSKKSAPIHFIML